MEVHAGQQRRFPAAAIVAVLFMICILPGQSWINKLFPAVTSGVRIKPALVFLDIPVPLPISMDPLLVLGLFIILYLLVILFYPSLPDIPSWLQASHRIKTALLGLLVLLLCLIAGSGIYYFAQDHLSRSIRNGIDSFGINADIALPFPGYETIHLRGSMILLVAFVIGMAICIRIMRKEPSGNFKEPGKQKPGRLTPEQRMSPYQRMLKESRTKGGEQINRKESIGYCYHKPVFSLEPEAVNYMPKF